MPTSDRTTKVAQAVLNRQQKLASRIKDMSSVGFGKERLTKQEFKSKVSKDEDFRMGMAEQMGGETLTRLMTEGESDGNN